MNKITNYLLSIGFLLSTFFAFSQNIGIGEWREHLSYRQTHGVAAVGQEIYVASPYGLFIYHQTDRIIDRLSKINGLSDIGFQRIAYDEETKSLFILYNNANIDIIRNGIIHNIVDIKQFSIVGEKILNNIFFDKQTAYICSNMGVIVININELEITDTYKIGENGEAVNVLDLTSDDSCFYAATENGIYKANKANKFLSYYESWEKLDFLPAKDGTYKYVEFFKDTLVYTLKAGKDTVYKQNLNGTAPQKMYYGTCYDLNTTANQLVMLLFSYFEVYKNDLTSTMTAASVQGEDIRPRQVVFSNGTYWIADYDLGLLKAENLNDIRMIGKPNGPDSHNVFSMSALKNQVWVSSGYYVNNTWYFGGRKDGVAAFDGSTWLTFNEEEENVPEKSHDFIVAAVNPNNTSQTFVGTWGCGLYQFDNHKVTTVYDENNSTLQPRTAETKQGVFISGLAFDSKGTLWVANSSCLKLLSSYDFATKTWKSYDLNTNDEDIREMMIDSYDQKWIITRHRQLLIFKESSDGNHVTRRISAPSAAVYSIACDNTGVVWIGTDAGIFLIDNPEDVLKKSGNAFVEINIEQPKIEYDGYTRLLLSGEIVSSIFVNGNNDKWVGTEYSGLYKIGAFGTEQLEHFTAENSPLFSDNVIDLCSTDNGELFIGTSYGVISYRDIATFGKEDNSEVYVFPNPVKPEYNGYIAITNLADKSYIKITDISGTLVYNCQANGGQAVWDGKNLNGQRVKTGVYLVFIANEDGTQKEVTKIMFLN